MPSSFSANMGANRREPLGSSETCIEMESNENEQGTGDDDDEDDHVFYSNYVSRMGQSSSYKDKKVQVGSDQEKAQSEKDSHSKNRGGKKNETNNKVLRP